MKLSKKFFFSVEGETEMWYFEWLSRSINASSTAKFKVSFDCMIEKDPLSRAKGMSVLGKTEIAHIFDRESEDPVHVQQFYLRSLDGAPQVGVQWVLEFSASIPRSDQPGISGTFFRYG